MFYFFYTFLAFCIVQNVKDKAFLKKLGQRIRFLRKEKGLSQLDLGVRMDNYAEQIGRIERGGVKCNCLYPEKNCR